MIKLNLNPEPSIVRQFAWFAVLGVPLLALLVLRLCDAFTWTHPALLVAMAVGVLQLVVYLTVSTVLSRVLFVTLSVVFMPIGFIISHILMMAIYYLVVTPIALVFRAMGRDVIGRKLEPDRKSYWHVRDGVRPPDSYFKLY